MWRGRRLCHCVSIKSQLIALGHELKVGAPENATDSDKHSDKVHIKAEARNVRLMEAGGKRGSELGAVEPKWMTLHENGQQFT